MLTRVPVMKLIPVYIIVLVVAIAIAHFGSHTVTTMVETAPIEGRRVIIVDAGHGGVDSGATSCTGVPESRLNLEIAWKLNDLLRFLGYETKMIRTDDSSVYTEGNTIGAQKVSDLKERVRMVNETENGILISIHQNTYPVGKYSGAQVFHANDEFSRAIAETMQSTFIRTVNPGSKRKCKSSEGIYLMQNIDNPGVLIECGFLTNAREEALLRSGEYQKKLACIIGTCIDRELNREKL